MVVQALPVIKAVEAVLKSIEIRVNRQEKRKRNSNLISHLLPPISIKIIWLAPNGKQFDTAYAKKTVKKYTDIIIICGRYEGIDARVKKIFKTDDISVGPFVLTGGELPAMIIIDCMSRQVEGVLGNFDSREEERVAANAVYTRPEVLEYKGKKYRAPKILLSGHQKKIEEWKRKH